MGYIQKVAAKTLHPKLLELDKYALVAGLACLSCAACMFIPPSWHAGQLQSVVAKPYPLSTAWVSSLVEIKRLALSRSCQCVLASAKDLTKRCEACQWGSRCSCLTCHAQQCWCYHPILFTIFEAGPVGVWCIMARLCSFS